RRLLRARRDFPSPQRARHGTRQVGRLRADFARALDPCREPRTAAPAQESVRPAPIAPEPPQRTPVRPPPPRLRPRYRSMRRAETRGAGPGERPTSAHCPGAAATDAVPDAVAR